MSRGMLEGGKESGLCFFPTAQHCMPLLNLPLSKSTSAAIMKFVMNSSVPPGRSGGSIKRSNLTVSMFPLCLELAHVEHPTSKTSTTCGLSVNLLDGCAAIQPCRCNFSKKCGLKVQGKPLYETSKGLGCLAWKLSLLAITLPVCFLMLPVPVFSLTLLITAFLCFLVVKSPLGAGKGSTMGSGEMANVFGRHFQR